MRRIALLSSLLMLSGCGFGSFLGDTFTLPGANPNMPHGDSETMERARGHTVAVPPILPQGGNIWPGRPEQVPSLQQYEQENAAATGQNGGMGGGSQGGAPPALGSAGPEAPPLLPGLSSQVPPPPAVGPTPSFGRGGRTPALGRSFALPNGEPATGTGGTSGAGTFNTPNTPGNIIIPNGNGTSTVIAPNGNVSTIQTPK